MVEGLYRFMKRLELGDQGFVRSLLGFVYQLKLWNEEILVLL